MANAFIFLKTATSLGNEAIQLDPNYDVMFESFPTDEELSSNDEMQQRESSTAAANRNFNQFLLNRPGIKGEVVFPRTSDYDEKPPMFPLRPVPRRMFPITSSQEALLQKAAKALSASRELRRTPVTSPIQQPLHFTPQPRSHPHHPESWQDLLLRHNRQITAARNQHRLRVDGGGFVDGDNNCEEVIIFNIAL